MDLAVPLYYKLCYTQKALAKVFHNMRTESIVGCVKWTLKFDPLGYFQISSYGQLLLKRSTNIEALRVKNVFTICNPQRIPHDIYQLHLVWLKDQTNFDYDYRVAYTSTRLVSKWY